MGGRHSGGSDRAHQQEDALPGALFEMLLARFTTELRRGIDGYERLSALGAPIVAGLLTAHPAFRDLSRRPAHFRVTRHGQVLTYQQGPAPAIGVGEVRWKPTLAGERDTPHSFAVRRSTLTASMLQLVDHGGTSQEMTLTGAVDAIVRLFIEHTADQRWPGSEAVTMH